MIPLFVHSIVLSAEHISCIEERKYFCKRQLLFAFYRYEFTYKIYGINDLQSLTIHLLNSWDRYIYNFIIGENNPFYIYQPKIHEFTTLLVAASEETPFSPPIILSCLMLKLHC